MTATMPEHRRVQIPRVVTRGPAAKKPGDEGSATGAAKDVEFFSNSPLQRQIRYQFLPDYDPNESDQQIEEKLNERFLVMEEMTQDTIDGRCRAFVCAGPGGVGKTHGIDTVLKKHFGEPEGEVGEEYLEPTGYTSYSGYSTKIGLLRMLWANRDGLVKADDIDSIFKDVNALQYLKVACDTTQKRIITYASEKVLVDENMETIPRRFEFKGRMIFSTNLDFDFLIAKGSALTEHLEALMTRSHYIDLGMKTKRDYLIRVFQVADQGLFDQVLGGDSEEPGLTQAQQDEALNFIEKYHRHLRECSLRMALKVGSLIKGYDPEKDRIHWERKALLTCCRNVK